MLLVFLFMNLHFYTTVSIRTMATLTLPPWTELARR